MPACADECRLKHQRVTAYLDEHDLDAVVLTRRANFAWFTGGGLNHVNLGTEGGAVSLAITRDQTVAVTNAIEAPRMTGEELHELGIEVRSYAWHDGAAAAPVWREVLGSLRAACDGRVAGLPDTVATLKSDFDRLRWSLVEPEIGRLRALARETASVLEQVCRQTRRGMTEFQLAARLSASLLEREIRAPVLLIAADDRARSYRHPIPTATRFAKHGMAVIGGERGGLIASCSRVFAFGPISSDLRRRHEAVCNIDAVMIGQTRPDRTLGDIFDLARKVYADSGYPDEWQYHHQGGPTGYTARDAKASPGNATKVLANQAFAWNPSIAGTKSEDTILVGPNANEILTATGQWPVSSYAGGGRNWDRCNILSL